MCVMGSAFIYFLALLAGAVTLTSQSVIIIISIKFYFPNLTPDQFSLIPRSVATFLNNQVQFTCVVDTVGHTLKWEVDGINARFLQSRNVSFHTVYDPNRESSHYAVSTLWIIASLINNNSEITCILSVFGDGEVTRTSASLLVQGIISIY